MMMPAGGETSARRERRLTNDAIRAAGSSLSVSTRARNAEKGLTVMPGMSPVDGRIVLGT
jgi:hypothetical protein